MEYKLKDLIDIQLIQTLQDNLNEIYSFPSALIDLEGNILTATAWQDICTKFHRVHPLTEKECIKSDQYIVDHLHEANPAVSYKCPHGLIDNAIPIVIDGKHLGNFFTGQLFLEQPDLAYFRERAKKYGFDEDAYLDAVSRVPVWSREQLDRYLSALKTFTEILAGLAIKNLEGIRSGQALKSVNEALAQSEKKFEAIANYAASWEAWFSPEGKLLWMNPFSIELTGFTPEDYLAADDLAMFFAVEDQPKIFEKFQEARNGKSGDNLEVRILRKDGSKFWAAVSWRPIYDENGQSIGFRTSTREISKRKDAEKALEESNELLSMFIHNSPIHAYIKEVKKGESRVVHASENFSEMVGVTGSEMIGKTMEELFPSHFAQKITEDDWTVVSEGKIIHVDEDLHGRNYSTIKFPIEQSDKKLLAGYTIDITDRKKIQKKLEDSESRLNRAELTSKSGNWEYHLNTNLMIGSEGAAKIYGVEMGKMDFEFVRNVPLPEYRPILDLALENLLKHDEPYNVEFRIKSADTGTIKDIRSVAVFDRSNRILFGIIQDVSDQKRAEESLHESYALNNSLLNTIPFGMDIVDEDGNILFISENLKKLSSGEAVGSKCWSIYRDDKTQCTECPLRGGLNIGKTELYETSGVLGGRTFQISHTGMMYQGKKAMLEIFQDITDKKEIERKVKLLAHSLESISECVSITDMNDRIIYVNESFLQTYGYLEEELIGKNINIVRPPEMENMQIRAILPKTIEGGWRGEIMNKRKDGTMFPILLSSSVIKDENGKLIALIGVALDISDMRRSRDELLQAKEKAEENNRLKSALLNNMSHEIRTPMNAIMGFSDLMKEADADEKISFAEIINNSSHQLLSLIDEVMFLSRLQSEKMPLLKSMFNPAELVSEVKRMYDMPQVDRGLVLLESVPQQYRQLTVTGDFAKIRQVLSNLVSNALKYTFKGYIEIGFDIKANKIEFFVRDSGLGIPDYEQAMVFEAFYRGEQAISLAIRGTGLGLNISQELVKLMGGNIGVSSIPGSGSRFHFTIPLEKANLDGVNKPSGKQVRRATRDLAILVVEDEPDNARYLKVILKNESKSVDFAVNGKDAIDMASRNLYDLVLMDLKMPVMEGVEATQRLKALFPDLSIIAQTACSSQEEIDIAIKAGCSEVIVKPISKEKLHEVMDRYG